MPHQLDIVILGLTVTSSWGNGHATTYRSLLRGLAARGHRVTFLERDMPWYADNRDLPESQFGQTRLYGSVDELCDRFVRDVRQADLVIVGSYVPEGIAVAEWVLDTAGGVRAFYDIDTPVTLAQLTRCDCEYLEPRLIPQFDLYLSFAAGRTLDVLERNFGSPCARPLLCSVDPEWYAPDEGEIRYELGYLGTYSPDRQPGVQQLLIEPASRRPGAKFVVAGPQFPEEIQWPVNVERLEHLPPAQHRRFYNSQQFTLNVTRSDMVRAGHSPSVRLFEAAACGTPIISDWWEGLDEYFSPGRDILPAVSTQGVLDYLELVTESQRQKIGRSARSRILAEHTGVRRAEQLENYFSEAVRRKQNSPAGRPDGRKSGPSHSAGQTASTESRPESISKVKEASNV